jgi:transcription initiation factor TFIIIB Brf1 subunit/transcription initiation factor TFIIB
MKRTYNEKFKDRSPKETIDIIKKYFKELGLTTRVEQIICSKSATWSCVIKLYLNSLPILS